MTEPTTKDVTVTRKSLPVTSPHHPIQEFRAKVLEIWKDKDKIRKLFASNLTQDEFDFFVGLGSALGANPFTHEIWAVKYESKKDPNKPASIFLGRDFYRRKAQEQPDYDVHIVDAIYSKDEFEVVNGSVKHKYKVGNRGELIGAYCLVYRRGLSRPFYVSVPLREYNKGFANWTTMPETMIKKVAECQGLRGAFQGLFAGTYGEGEEWAERAESPEVAEVLESATAEDKPEPEKSDTADKSDKKPEDPKEPMPMTKQQRERIFDLSGTLNKAGVTKDEIRATLGDLELPLKPATLDEADVTIEALEMMLDKHGVTAQT